MDLSKLRHEAETGLMETFGQKAVLTAAAPGRVNLIGEHIDYCDGFVLPFALEQNIIIAAAPNESSTVRLASSLGGDTVEIDISGDIPEAEPKWANYPRGVMHYFREETGCALPGLMPISPQTFPQVEDFPPPLPLSSPLPPCSKASPASFLTSKPRRCSARKPSTTTPTALVVSWISLLPPLASKTVW